MKLTELNIGAKVELTVLENYKPKTYKTIVADIVGDSIFVMNPIEMRDDWVLNKDRECKLVFGFTNNLFMWRCKLGEVTRNNHVQLLKVTPLREEGERHNRRTGYRVAYVNRLDYIVKNDKGENEKIVGKFKDISISGIGFYSPYKHEIGEIITISFEAKNKTEYIGIEIRRRGLLENDLYFYGAEYLTPPTTTIEKLVNELQLVELRRRRNALL